MYRQFILPLLQRVDAECAHSATLRILAAIQRYPGLVALVERTMAVSDPRLRVSAFGLSFANPVGLAAGFDKNGVACRAIASLGFGHVEVGTVTPLPQVGTPRPRVFRLGQDDALINRMGFPNGGVRTLGRTLNWYQRRDWRLGINIGPNRDNVVTARAVADYVHCLTHLHRYVDYVAINVSSPNTEGLRNLQSSGILKPILEELLSAAHQHGIVRPILVKISPDLRSDELFALLDVVSSYPIAGIIAANTTIQRSGMLRSSNRGETGGLSGAPMREQSTELIRSVFRYTAGALPIIGVGGVFTVGDALEKILAGASLVQLYTGLVYRGPSVARMINVGLARRLDVLGVGSVQALVGQGADRGTVGTRSA
jgi:dihydroorotate dehydrogenase